MGFITENLPRFDKVAFGAVSGAVDYVYALKSSVYDYAELTSEVTVPDDGIVSFHVKAEEGASIKYICRSSGISFIYYRQTDGRFRISFDDGNIYTFSGVEISTSKFDLITLRFLNNQCEMYINNVFYDERFGPHGSFSVNRISEGIDSFGFTFGNLASYPMLTETPSGTNPFDMIGSNDLTFVNLKDPLNEDDYEKVIDND